VGDVAGEEQFAKQGGQVLGVESVVAGPLGGTASPVVAPGRRDSIGAAGAREGEVGLAGAGETEEGDLEPEAGDVADGADLDGGKGEVGEEGAEALDGDAQGGEHLHEVAFGVEHRGGGEGHHGEGIEWVVGFGRLNTGHRGV
jgi:hypothetical protein